MLAGLWTVQSFELLTGFEPGRVDRDEKIDVLHRGKHCAGRHIAAFELKPGVRRRLARVIAVVVKLLRIAQPRYAVEFDVIREHPAVAELKRAEACELFGCVQRHKRALALRILEDDQINTGAPPWKGSGALVGGHQARE